MWAQRFTRRPVCTLCTSTRRLCTGSPISNRRHPTRKLFPGPTTSTPTTRRFHTGSPILALNQFGVDLLPPNLQKLLFSGVSPRPNVKGPEDALKELRKYGLSSEEGQTYPLPDDIGGHLPQILNNNISQHLRAEAEKQVAPYTSLLYDLLIAEVPPLPPEVGWEIQSGWTRYGRDGSRRKVPYPLERCAVFDVEVCVKEDPRAVMAVAVTEDAWYAWLSPNLLSATPFPPPTPSSMVPLGSDHQPRLVIGHNVSYDRVRCGDEYRVQGSGTRFLDTMSMHIAVSGMTSSQRMLKQSVKNLTKEEMRDKPRWLAKTSMNGLADVFSFYCKSDKPLDKDPRDSFVKLGLSELRQDIPALLTYCASDVQATLEVVRVLFPLFSQHCPHPATLAGMLTMSTAFLPTSSCWDSFIREADGAYDRLESEMMLQTELEAKEAVVKVSDLSYRRDPWLWDMDWKVASQKTIKARRLQQILASSSDLQLTEHELLSRGFPTWYQDLASEDEEGKPFLNLSPSKRVVPKLLRLTWKGFPLHHHKVEKWGYLIPTGDVDNVLEMIEDGDLETDFPLREFMSIVNEEKPTRATDSYSEGQELLIDEISEMAAKKKKESKKTDEVGIDIGLPGVRFCGLPHKNGSKFRVGNPLSKDFLSSLAEGGNLASMKPDLAEQLLKLNICLSYWRSSRDRIREQVKVNFDPEDLPEVVTQSETFSTEAGLGAIIPSMVVAGTITRRAVEKTWLTASNAKKDRVGSELKSYIRAPPGYHLVGADVDSQELWLASVLGDAEAGGHGATALGWMCLQGTKSKGTDLHSKTAAAAQVTRDQAKILNYGRIYGAGEPFAKLLLMQFNSSLSELEASRRAAHMYEQTKGSRKYKLNILGVWLYNLFIADKEGRARTNLHTVHEKKTIHRLGRLMALLNMIVEDRWKVKGKTVHGLNQEGREMFVGMEKDFDLTDVGQLEISDSLLVRLVEHMNDQHRSVVNSIKSDYDTSQSLVQQVVWCGGSESHTFNRLEEIAMSDKPVTPVLKARITTALDSRLIGRGFLTSRINWVVQSSAVDYLHLLLVAVQWLFAEHGVRGRFVLSIHDEIRYMVVSEDRYKAALALHLANLMVRCEVCARIGLDNLPASTAFFSSVDVDQVMRKEPDADCVTPSNMLGLKEGHGVPAGEGLDIFQVLKHLDQLNSRDIDRISDESL